MEPTVMRDAHGNSFWVTKTFLQPEINLDPASDPLALDVKPKPEPSSVKLEPESPFEPETEPMIDQTAFNSTPLKQETDPLALDVKPKPELLEVKQESGLPWDPDTDPLDNITDNNAPRTPRSPPRFVPFNSSTPQARSIEPSAMNATAEPPSDMQDSLPQGILPDSRSAEDQSSSVFNEAPEPAVARSDSTDNQVFDSVCRSDCVDSESRDDDSIQLTSDTSLAVKYNLKQCSVSLRRVSFTHTAPGVVSDRSPVQSSDKEQPSTSRGSKRPRKAPGKAKPIPSGFRCKFCSREFSSSSGLCRHIRLHPKPHVACAECRRTFKNKSDLDNHRRIRHDHDYSCDVCGKIYSNRQGLGSHKSLHSESPPTCSVCNKTFGSNRHLLDHMRIHEVNKIVIQCDVCGKSFSDAAYVRHMKTHNKEFKCDMCGKTSSSKLLLTDHILNHMNIKDHVCKICGKSFGRKSSLYAHRTMVHSNIRDIKCDLCGKAFKADKHLKSHMRSHSKKFKCNICEKSFADKTMLKYHILQHLNILDFKCETCGESFVSQTILNYHKQRHVTPRYPCEDCDKTFVKKSTVKKHKLRHHRRPSDGPGFPCSCCSKFFSSKQELMNHLKSHGLFCASCDLICSDVASFKAHIKDVHGGVAIANLRVGNRNCKTCGQGFKSLKRLSKHEKIHVNRPLQCAICRNNFATKEKIIHHIKRKHVIMEYSCDVCAKTFTCEKYLNIHKRCHYYPAKCNICKKVFSSKSNLRIHISSCHSTEPVENHSCDICSRSFNSATKLKVHRRGHSKLFKCEELNCDKAFGNKHNLTRHQEVHVTEKIHKCDICEKSFGMFSRLIDHKRSHVKNFTCNECGKSFKDRSYISVHMARVHKK